MSRSDAARDHFAEQLADYQAQRGDADPAWLAPVRQAALARFDELGLPTRRDEAWKYTNPAPIVDGAFRPVAHAAPAAGGITREDVARIFGESAAQCCLVFENGQWVESLSALDGLPEAVVATGLSALLRDAPERARTLIEPAADALQRPFSALNLAFGGDGAFVRIAETLERPLELLFLHSPAAQGRFTSPRSWIAHEAGATATVSMRYASISADSDAYLTNAVTSVSLGANAQLDLVTVQTEARDAIHLASIDVEQQRDSRFRSHHVSLGAKLSRSEIACRLAETGADCTLNGVYVADDREHVDNQTVIDHASPHTTSRELYKGICGGRARGVFNGLVRVHKDAQKINAEQSNPNLLLSDRAQVNAKPTLEIYADDVKCSHGSTIGRLDESALFYLRARGIPARDAERMLTEAFAAEVADAIPDEKLRDFVAAQVRAKLTLAARESR